VEVTVCTDENEDVGVACGMSPDNAPEDLDLEYGAMPLSLLMEALDLKLRSGTGPGAAGRLPFLSGVVTVSVT